MEIDITAFCESADPYEFSASRAEMGDNAGRITWANAKREAAEAPLLTTEAQFDALRDWARESGGWDREEIATWDADECNALFVQLISGDLREIENFCTGDDGKIDWTLYEEESLNGNISGHLYQGDDGKIYYYLGN